MKVLNLFFFLIIFLLIFSCNSKKPSIEEILTNHIWKVDEIELVLDVHIDSKAERKATDFVLGIVKNFDIVFTEKQELQVIWNGDLYKEDKVFWEVDQKDSTIIFSMENVKYDKKMKVEKISEKEVTLKGKIDENTPLVPSEGEGTLTLKVKEEEEE